MIFDARAGSTRGFVLYLSNGHPRLQIHSSEGKIMCDSAAVLPNDTWMHLTAIFNYSSENLQLYINGTLDQSVAFSNVYSKSTYSAAIGNNRWAPGDGNWRHFNGLIDELRFYDRAITTSEIKYLFNNPSGNQAPVANASGPYVGYFSTDVEFSGTACYDLDEETLLYYWDFGDGTYSSVRNPIHRYDAAGNYTVSVMVTDGVADSDTAATYAIISYPPEQPGFELVLLFIAVIIFVGLCLKKQDR